MLPRMGATGITASVLLLLCIVSSVNSFTKYGRGCGDIGCLPNEECVITSDSCSYSQREGKDCGNYPTCRRKSGSSASSSPVSPSGSSLKPGAEHAIFSPASSNPTLNTHTYYNHNGNGASAATGAGGAGNSNNNNNNINNGYLHKNGNGHSGNSNSNSNDGLIGSGSSGGAGQGGRPNTAGIDPHYVFGAPQSVPILPNLPIFPYNSPTQPPSFQQFPQPNHPGSVLNPGYPGGLQPVNPYNSPFVFGQQPYYSGSPAGTGGPPGGSNGILGGSGGGLAPPGSYYGGYQNPNMYNKPPPQYQNQNPYNRQTQTHRYSGAGVTVTGNWQLMTLLVCGGQAMVAFVLQQLTLSIRRST